MNKKKKLHIVINSILAMSSAVAFSAHAGIMTNNISVNTYRRFGLNQGPFRAGAKNVPIYSKSGSLIGHIPLIPNFNGVSDLGYDTFIGPDAVGSAGHVGYSTSATWYIRFYRKNARLFSGEDTKEGRDELGLTYQSAYNTFINGKNNHTTNIVKYDTKRSEERRVGKECRL